MRPLRGEVQPNLLQECFLEGDDPTSHEEEPFYHCSILSFFSVSLLKSFLWSAFAWCNVAVIF